MRLVLEAAHITHYGVIINKVPKKTADRLRDSNTGLLQQAKVSLNLGLPVASEDFFVIDRYQELDDEENMLWTEMPSFLKDFIDSVTPLEIRSEIVDNIEVDQLGRLLQEQERALKNIENNKEELQSELRRQKELTKRLADKALQQAKQRSEASWMLSMD